MSLRIVFLFFSLFFTSTCAQVFEWTSASTGSAGPFNMVQRNCPSSFADVLNSGDFDSLMYCTEKELRDMYAVGNCCIDFIAECNYVERAWWTKTNVVKHAPLCPSLFRSSGSNKKERKRRFMMRIKKRFAENAIMMK